jgi:hypothetical protein
MIGRDYNQFEKKRPEGCKNKRENCKECQAHCHCTLQEIVIAKQISDEKGTTSKTFNVGYTC